MHWTEAQCNAHNMHNAHIVLNTALCFQFEVFIGINFSLLLQVFIWLHFNRMLKQGVSALMICILSFRVLSK